MGSISQSLHSRIILHLDRQNDAEPIQCRSQLFVYRFRESTERPVGCDVFVRHSPCCLSAPVFTQHACADEFTAQEFDHRIAPLIAQRCLTCHGGDEPEGKLDLSSRERGNGRR